MSTARKPGTLRRLGLGAAMIAVATAPLTVALPAEAATTAFGCTAAPLAPVFAGLNGAGVKQVRYNVLITCAANRSIEVQQTFMEDDAPPNPDDFTGTVVNTTNFPGAAITTTGVTVDVPDTEAGPEELYQKIRFRVTGAGGVQSAWTLFESSPNTTIAN